MKPPLPTFFVVLALAVSAARGGPVMPSPLSQGNAEFAVDIYKRLAAGQKGNLFLSPYSISSVVAMAYAGARGKTADEMAKTMRFEAAPEALHTLFGELHQSINDAGKTGKVKLSAANALWGMKGAGFERAFLELTRRFYGAGLTELDFGDSKGAAKTINAWVARETQDKIQDLIPAAALNEGTRLVLTNAIYFKGDWDSQFKKEATQEQPFVNAAAAKVKVPLMFQKGDFAYLETPDMQGLELPYMGGRLSMVVLLPKKNDGLGALEKSLTAKGLSEWLSRLATEEVLVHLPKFKVTASFGLAPTLVAMGMKAAFTPAQADFSGMNAGRDLFVSAVVHKAFIDVNEEGTEAAAATGMMMAIESVDESQPRAFRADHPFLYLIRDKVSGGILFMGRLEDPRG